MKKPKNDLYLIEAKDLICGVDFEVVTNTPYNGDVTVHFYEFENHEIDTDLATMLGLGVVKNLHIVDDYYIYNASNDHADNFGFMNEVTRIAIYYQITHPHYDDKELEEFIINTERGRKYLKKLQTVDSDMPFQKLKEIYDRKKGNLVLLDRQI
ncbi:hypothetical protein BN1058_00542 [Paraliobacillus sp. PM-2]|uniref:hypothetical protein n=1 Tax=Paraliobacillus sp. PM-2 TaxID=1462524 RepID=UPI00061C6B92|nr:hypothetical protein [Paraliobacillus sp. PM-2]CQR46289.1 hypothetical protein BN1058_00542 [Paraliobacillus sp. PM-2]